MEKAAAMVVGHSVHMTGCGRTDAGVHARCYVANFRTTSRIPVDRLPYALNTHLPCDIVVTKAFEVHENFNAIGLCARRRLGITTGDEIVVVGIYYLLRVFVLPIFGFVRKGSLQKEKDADVLIMDKDLNIRAVWQGGKLVEETNTLF